MKKVLSIALLVVMISALCVPFMSSAATVNDVVAELEKNPTAKYFKSALESVVKVYGSEITTEQADKLLAIAKDYNAAITADKGESAHKYDAAEIDAANKAVKDACAVLGWTVSYTASADAQHTSDQVVTVYDKDGQKVVTFDGDVLPFFVEYVGKDAQNPDPGKKTTPGKGSSVIAKTGLAETSSVVVAVIAVVAVIGTAVTAVKSVKEN